MTTESPSKNLDVSVLMLFHARPDHFSKVWQEVRMARPARLFLYQDGPRMVTPQGEPVTDPRESKDWKGLVACRELVADSEIDWPCEVHRNYREVNQGCDPSGFLSQQWAFSLTDKCIVLEDDVVPSQGFFTFCKEMLDRYEHDERITMIAGFNTDEQTKGITTDYFFTRAFSIWGWASWARVINHRDGQYTFLKDPKQLAQLEEKRVRYHQSREAIPSCMAKMATGKQYFECIFWAYMMLHDGLAIMPRVNMINNIGLEDGTHYSAQLDLMPRRLRQQFTMERYDLPHPLHHPDEVKEYPDYQKRLYLRNAWNHPWRKVQYSIEELWLNLRSGNFSKITSALRQRLIKTLRRGKVV